MFENKWDPIKRKQGNIDTLSNIRQENYHNLSLIIIYIEGIPRIIFRKNHFDQ